MEHVIEQGREVTSADHEAIRKEERAQRFELKVGPDQTGTLEVTRRRIEPVTELFRDLSKEAKDLPPHWLAVRVDVKSEETASDELWAGQLEKDTLTLTYRTAEAIEYGVTELAGAARDITLSHEPREEWGFVDGKKEPVTLALTANATAEHRFDVERFTTKVVKLTELGSEEAETLAMAERFSPELRQAIREGSSRQRTLEAAERSLQAARTEEEQVISEQTRLRTNLEKLPPDSALYKRYIEKFDQEETRLERIRERVSAEEDAVRKAEAALAEFFRKG